MMINFFVPGYARPQGSKRHVGNGIMVEQTDVKAWRGVVAVAAHQAMKAAGDPALFAGAVELQLEFYFPRPAGHYGTGKHAQRLKASSPPLPISGRIGDADKLARGICDALTGVVFIDDGLVSDLIIRKRYAGSVQPGVHITVHPQ
jgi:crossover junction endodeoxyribonuclease RusA